MTLQATFYQYGDRIDFTAGASLVPAGTVQFQNDLFSAAALDIAAGRKGALATRGVFFFAKAAVAFFAGQRVYWDLVNLVATSDPTAGPILGAAMLAQLAGDASVYVLVDSLHTADSYYVLPAAGAAVSNTIVETVLAQCNFPANRLSPFDVIRFRAQGIVSAHNGADTLTVKGYMGGNLLFTTGAIDDAANDIFVVEGDITVRALGNAAAGLIVAGGNQSLGTPGTATQKVWNLPATNMDTTIAELLKFTAQWSAASAADSVRMDHMCVELLRQQ